MNIAVSSKAQMNKGVINDMYRKKFVSVNMRGKTKRHVGAAIRAYNEDGPPGV